MSVQMVLISGKMGSGKTTLTSVLLGAKLKVRAEFRFASILYRIHDIVRSTINDLGIGTPEAVKVKDGALLQFLGTEWGRKTYGEDIWVRATKNKVLELIEKVAPHNVQLLIVISDCRFQNEFDAFPEALRVRLECAKDIRKQRCEQWRENDTHPSETDLDDYVYKGKFDLIYDTQFTMPETIADNILACLDRGDWIKSRNNDQ